MSDLDKDFDSAIDEMAAKILEATKLLKEASNIGSVHNIQLFHDFQFSNEINDSINEIKYLIINPSDKPDDDDWVCSFY